MKEKIVFVLCFILLTAGITACERTGNSNLTTNIQGTNASEVALTVDEMWEKIGSLSYIREYVRDNYKDIDVEILKAEAGAEDKTLEEQLRALILLCEYEYKKNRLESGRKFSTDDEQLDYRYDYLFEFDYPISNPYVCNYLSKVNTQPDEFWASLETSTSYNYFELFLAAGQEIDSVTFVRLITNVPVQSVGIETNIKRALDKWLGKRPEVLLSRGQDLFAAGYFNGYDRCDIQNKFFLMTGLKGWKMSIEESLAYLSYVKEEFLPMMESIYDGTGQVDDNNNGDNFSDVNKEMIWLKTESDLFNELYYDTGMMIPIGDVLELEEPAVESSEFIETTEKSVAAFYLNPYANKRDGSPNELRLLGDFMLFLSAEQFPRCLAELDYYLILTPQYVNGDYYKLYSGKITGTRPVYSYTSIDLYEAQSGRYLRHLGTVLERPDSRFVYFENGKAAYNYPEEVSPDILYYIYQNVNEPDNYNGLITVLQEPYTELSMGEKAYLQNWEVVFESYDMVQSFDDGMHTYYAQDGQKLLRANFTVTNKSMRKASLNLTYFSDSTKNLIKYEPHTCDFSRELGSWSCFLCFDLV